MTIKTFWTIFLKILGIYIVFGSLTVIPQFVSSLMLLDADNGFIVSIIIILLTLGAYLLILRLFVFKTEWLINKLDLIKGFEEEKFEINIHRSTILKIAIIVIGGLIFIEDFPLFCKEMFSYFQQSNSSGLFGSNPTSSWVIFYFIKTLLGYLMMTNSNRITNLIERQRKTN
ncbi:MAG: hypothetical protein H6587_12220 [Flavobacteriales bacterium]|nr:hypothetical protein [Flavobacteriales bacterium]MCB9363960.1 hypothetical protein [Flavobacteriales bacterium]MCB9365327.1 hypothetical protein [Flavobacteriales bacterium]